MKALVLLLPLVGLSVASSQQQQPLVPDHVPPPQPYCVDRPPQGQCYTAEVCNHRGPSGQKPCDYYTVTYDKDRTPVDEKCEMDPKRPRCGKQVGGMTCDPHNGWGTCCSGDGYCGSGEYYCKIQKPCEGCPRTGGCQSGDCYPLEPVGPDNKCGAQNGGKLCDASINAGRCCSNQGECGSTSAHCGQGCQSGCTEGPSTQNRCGVQFNGKLCSGGQCCSKFGYCGNSADHCGEACQSGSCTKPPPENRCGLAFDNKICASGECCSKDGFCGTSSQHCSAGCQAGPCDQGYVTKTPKCSSEKPNQILACACKPGEEPTWQTIVNAPCEKNPTAETAGYCPLPNENQPAIENFRRTCPHKDGTRTKINGVEYQYFCSSSLSPSGVQSIANVFDYRSCASLCSDDDYCQGFTWNSEKATCHFAQEAAKVIQGPAGSLVLSPTSPRGDAAFCPSHDGKDYTISGEVYKVACSSKLESKTESSGGDTASAMECGRKCSADLTCEGLTWNPKTKVCSLQKADPDAKFAANSDSDALQKINSPGKKQKVQSSQETEPSGQGDYHRRGPGNFCKDGPKYADSMDSADNPNRRLLTIGGETFLLSCTTTFASNVDSKILYNLTPWMCAEACAEDKYCAGVFWKAYREDSYDVGCKLALFAKDGTNFGTSIMPSGDTVASISLIRKSVKGKLKYCVVPDNPKYRKVGECPDSD